MNWWKSVTIFTQIRRPSKLLMRVFENSFLGDGLNNSLIPEEELLKSGHLPWYYGVIKILVKVRKLEKGSLE
jgi:hypothetical protein